MGKVCQWIHKYSSYRGLRSSTSAYDAYDRLSPAFAAFLEGLTAVHSAEFFVEVLWPFKLFAFFQEADATVTACTPGGATYTGSSRLP